MASMASGRLDDAATERVEAHLAACTDCVAELELLRAVGSAYAVAPLNAATIAAALPQARVLGRSRAYYQQPLWRMAAAMALMVVGAAGVVVLRRADPAGDGLALVSPDGGALAAGTLAETTLALRSGTGGPAAITLGGSLADLTDAQLEALLADIEGIDGSVSAEPVLPAAPIMPSGTDGAARRNE